MRIDWIAKLQHMLQTMAFALAQMPLIMRHEGGQGAGTANLARRCEARPRRKMGRNG